MTKRRPFKSSRNTSIVRQTGHAVKDILSINATISVRHGDAVASPTLKNWPLFGQKFSKFWQSIQQHSHVSEVVSIFQTKTK